MEADVERRTQMPQLGFGVWRVAEDEPRRSSGRRPSPGYRLVDTAAIYGNERASERLRA